MSGNLIGVMTAASTDAGRIEAADTGIKVVVVEDDEVERCCHELGRLAVINEFVYNSGRFSYVETKTAFPRLPTNCRLFLDVCGSVQTTPGDEAPGAAGVPALREGAGRRRAATREVDGARLPPRRKAVGEQDQSLLGLWAETLTRERDPNTPPVSIASKE
ncbi:hypothetical protein OCS_01192 [Ophiocordyceps sinensis CO18]|uniref:Uncharacterized protein n=1 Tax=Ophiocordyceps sinensis (strain Co18 / CGMCC 3.14243) TaxID=911162 RepID=T5AMW5_OPHSC|nr:hypothetical protein OCS_01192 [Ophiocordyceps sinensis CO18]